MYRSIAASFFVCLCVLTQNAGAQQAPKVRTCSLHVQVTDEDGGMVDRAFVLIHSDTGVKLSQQLVLDQTGQTKIALRPQLYDLFVSSAGFAPVAQIVDLRSCKPLDINLMLVLDSEHGETSKD